MFAPSFYQNLFFGEMAGRIVDFSYFQTAHSIKTEQCSLCGTELFYVDRSSFEDIECLCDPPRIVCSRHSEESRSTCAVCVPFEEPESSSSEEAEEESEEEKYRYKYKKLKKTMKNMKKRFRDE